MSKTGPFKKANMNIKDSKVEEKETKEPIDIIARFIVGVAINPFVFQFILWRFIHRDIPWYMDIWVGLFFANKYAAQVLGFFWILTLVVSYCGFDYPFFHIPLEK